MSSVGSPAIRPFRSGEDDEDDVFNETLPPQFDQPVKMEEDDEDIFGSEYTRKRV